MWGQWIYIFYIILIQQKFSPDSLMNLYLWYVLFCIKFSLTTPFEISWHVTFSFVSLLEICYSHKTWINSKSQRESQWKSCVYSVSHWCCAFEKSANKSCLEEWSVCETVREWSRYLNIGILEAILDRGLGLQHSTGSNDTGLKGDLHLLWKIVGDQAENSKAS